MDELVRELLARPPYALGWTKRVVNARMKDHMLRSLDSSVACEMINFLQRKLGAPRERGCRNGRTPLPTEKAACRGPEMDGNRVEDSGVPGI